MKNKFVVAILLASVLMLSMFLLSPAAAQITLPATATVTAISAGPPPVQISITVSDLSADLKTGTYTGYCIELGSEVSALPFSATVVDTYNAGSPWNEINWLLNNYPDSLDLQKAIWLLQGNSWAFLISQGWGPQTQTVDDIVTAAQAHSGFLPSDGQYIGVRLENDGQDLLIKVQIPGNPGLTPGFWKNNLAVYLGLANGNRGYSNPTGSPTVTKATMEAFFDSLAGQYDLPQLYRDLCPQLDGTTAQIRNDAANIFNVEAGLSPGPPWN